MTESVRECDICQKPLTAKRSDARFCSASCRSISSRKNRGIEPERPPADHRRCGRCHEVKHVDEFYFLNGKRKRYQSYCKSCQRQAQKESKRAARGLPLDAVLKPGREAPIGATYVHRGYRYVKTDGHHRADRHGWVFEHILVAEHKYGIRIDRGFTIHHRNRNGLDNRPDNLELRVGKHGKGGDLMDTLLNDPAIRQLAVVALRRYGYEVIDRRNK